MERRNSNRRSKTAQEVKKHKKQKKQKTPLMFSWGRFLLFEDLLALAKCFTIDSALIFSCYAPWNGGHLEENFRL